LNVGCFEFFVPFNFSCYEELLYNEVENKK
jgi:hypothetical protein